MVMPSLHQALDRDVILRAISSFYGITTADGNIGGTTLFCSTLIGANDFISDKTILLQSGLAIFEDSAATAFNPVNGQITISPAFSSQVLAGTSFYVLNTSSAAAAIALLNLILTRIGDPSGHILTSLTGKWGDIARSLDLILGARWDGAGDLGTDIAAILAAIGPAGFSQGLVYYGVVTGVPGANQFEIAALAGLGAAKFATVVPEYQYHAFVLRDGAGGGAPPQGESQPVSNYATLTGNFTANAFTVPVGIGDEILIIHPYLARIMNFYGLPPAVGSLAANWQAAEANIVQLGAANTKYKLHSLLIDINNLAGTVTVRMYQQVVGVERRVYEQTFTVAADGPGLWIVNGTVGIHEVLRVTAQSNNVADNGQAIGYDYMLEAM